MSDQRTQPEKEQIAHEILEYLCDHPGAQDTLEGIMQWWLLERRIYRHTSAVQEALQSLAEQEYVYAETASEGGPVYRINAGQIEWIRTILKRRQGRMTIT